MTDYRRLRNQPCRWLNLVALFEGLFPDDDVIKVNYFTAQVTGKFDPHKPLRLQAYLRALCTLPKLEIGIGQFLTTKVNYRLVDPITHTNGQRLESVAVWRPEEKGSDVNMGSRLPNDAWSDAFDVAAVLTNDSENPWGQGGSMAGVHGVRVYGVTESMGSRVYGVRSFIITSSESS